jgi:hypothetical protein
VEQRRQLRAWWRGGLGFCSGSIFRRGEKDREAGQVTVKGRIGRCSRRLVSDGKKIDEQEMGCASKQN